MVVTYHLFSINTRLRRVYPGAVSYNSRSGGFCRQTGGVRRGGTVSGAWAGGRRPDGPSDRVCGAVRLLRRLAGVDVSSAAQRRRTSRQCSGRARRAQSDVLTWSRSERMCYLCVL